MTFDRIIIIIILLFTILNFIVKESRPTKVGYERNEFHIHKAYMEVYSNGWGMSAISQYQTAKEVGE